MYMITEGQKTIENKVYCIYGIRLDDEYCVSDISSNKESIEQLVHDCNKYALDPIHLCDVAEDFII